MADGAFDHATEAFSFIETLETLATPEDVIKAMERSLSLFGFKNFVMVGLPPPDRTIENFILAQRWPEGWGELYIGERYNRFDPVVRRCRQTTQPFEWSEAPYDPEREPRAAEVMGRAADFGMARGFTLPIHGANSYEACASMSGVHLDLTGRTKPALHLMAMYAFERARRILRPEPPGMPNPLTQRERECLTWCAMGKTSQDIGDILGISEGVVRIHVQNAQRKLNCLNRTHAVVRAMSHKFILPHSEGIS